MNNQQKLAELAVKIGVNLQPDQSLVINTPIECSDFARMVAEAAYKAGAWDVRMNYSDEKFSRIRYKNAGLKALEEVPQWFVDKQKDVVSRGAAVISIYAEDPDLFADVDPTKIKAASAAVQRATEAYHMAMMNNQCRWCVVSVPTAGWAKKVFPDVPEDEATDKLWAAILKATRADLEDPVAAWQACNQNFEAKTKFLNDHQFDKFIYKNGRGTCIEVGMPENHIWAGGSEKAQDGVEFFPNIPTEEVFCAPHRDRINGTLVSSHPLVYNGQLIDKFSLSFKDGVVTGYTAQVGQDALKTLVEASKGSDRLGEIALVPYHSPISDMNLLFYNTLFDENASCHFALGAAYPTCVEGGETMDPEALKAAGLNYSTTHVDFMVGTEDLSIVGVKKDGTEVQIFKDGDWAI
ncbi:MAG: aminopeptidase [Eubacterium sp.]|nr:aminopeptidase [Eubacterium sp.]